MNPSEIYLILKNLIIQKNLINSDDSSNRQDSTQSQETNQVKTMTFETLSLSTIQQSNDNILLKYSDSSGKTDSVIVTISTTEKEIFSGTFYTPMFETIVNNESNTPYFIDIIVEHQDYGRITYPYSILEIILIL